MQYYEDRHLKREIELLPEVEGFQGTARQIIHCVQPRHYLEERDLRRKLRIMVSGLRHYALHGIKSRPDPEPGEERIRRNCSITMIRQIHREILKEIEQLARKWPGKGTGRSSLEHSLRSKSGPGRSSRPSRVHATTPTLLSKTEGPG